jgi:hypothetical protein
MAMHSYRAELQKRKYPPRMKTKVKIVAGKQMYLLEPLLPPLESIYFCSILASCPPKWRLLPVQSYLDKRTDKYSPPVRSELNTLCS